MDATQRGGTFKSMLGIGSKNTRSKENTCTDKNVIFHTDGRLQGNKSVWIKGNCGYFQGVEEIGV